MTESSIAVQWGPVDCRNHNGNITSYSVRYGVVGSGNTQTVSLSGSGKHTIMALTPSTNYTIEVAAMNNAGIGTYSNPIYQLTQGE